MLTTRICTYTYIIPWDIIYSTSINMHATYKRKSCSQHGVAPFTVTVVDLTFCNFNVTYVLNWDAEK